MAVNTPRPSRISRLEPGAAWVAGLLVTLATVGVAVFSASVLGAVFVAFGITIALALGLGLLI